MKTPEKIVQPVQFYFALFLGIGFLLLAIMIWSFYAEGNKLQKTVEEQTYQEAKKELISAINHTLEVTRDQLKSLSEWDEVHQQFHDPSYYFFWHDNRLIESSYYQPYYLQLELYTTQRKLLMPASPENHHEDSLPESFAVSSAVVGKTPNGKSFLNLSQPIYDRANRILIGYIGLSLDLHKALLAQNQFYYLNKHAIQFNNVHTVSIEELVDFIDFSPVSNPVNNYLWELTQKFIFELIAILLTVSLLLMLFFNKLIRSPLTSLSHYLQRLKSNPHQSHTPPEETYWVREFEEFKSTIHDFHRNLHSAQIELDQQNLLVWEQARRDALTNTFNRRAFDEMWNDIFINFQTQPKPTAFMLFDCDFFKALNDTYGHEVGDEMIKASAKVIQQSLPMECPVYRIGGDEFALIIQNRTQSEILEIAQTCLDALNQYPYQSLGIKEKISFSIGISSIASSANDYLTSLPRQADIAMYKAKQSHHSKIQVYHRSLEKESSALVSNQIISRVVDSIHTGEHIQMHFQPIVAIDQSNCYYEALIRIQGQEGLINPVEIFSVVERRRLEVELDQQVIRATLTLLQQNKIPKDSGLSVNISGKTLLHPDLIELFTPFRPWIEHYKIVIEVTENFLIDHIEYAQKVLNELRQQGFLIALDDFGSGYSSIRYLAHMPVDIIKFDMSMIQALNSDSKTRQIILTTADMIRKSGFDLVMEGIEDETMLEQAKAAGATHIQGYLLGKPVPHFEQPCECQ
ncbi:MAG: bifunctional diguanylate cyclase/phosphodiesterase [Thiomicrorhabdus chilensis]|uniref:bifunctional diguanylate cyclase/phosphodiesterase n=1 Tax=Thiomicrorhabdus chilensis TaxID=63656 RepID=UPI00299D0B71|nr:bifunctional diguanylate cyclase/phosphodiesterase [Thiomicrorhabdus chilensis]MDX1346713.1 bifunctional diguanylate cyclase/phosphodiesterase [Thiomicrorhabdus chilensis]